MSAAAPSRTLPLATTKIIATIDEGIGWITFNNPARRNAMSLEMWKGLGEAVEAFQADPEVRVVVMRGAGGKSFVSGADISEFDQHRANAEQMKSYGEIAARAHVGLTRLMKPLIAMIEGYCIGGGLALALGADIRFATTVSTFGVPAAKLGLGYEYRGLATLARLVGPSTAKDILFSARFLAADEALRVGLINFVVEQADLEQRVRDYATRIVNNAPLTIHAAKSAVRLFEQYSAEVDDAEVAALVAHCFDSDDYKEGRTAFLEKRKPHFKGH